jgi:hypothetical protein
VAVVRALLRKILLEYDCASEAKVGDYIRSQKSAKLILHDETRAF